MKSPAGDHLIYLPTIGGESEIAYHKRATIDRRFPADLGIASPWQNSETIDPAWHDRSIDRLTPAFIVTYKPDRLDAITRRPTLPMVWTPTGATLAAGVDAATRHPAIGFLVTNEPEIAAQANLAPYTAARGHEAMITQTGGEIRPPGAPGGHRHHYSARGGAAICGPNVIASPAGFQYLDQYLAAGGPLPDLWGFHIYFERTIAGVMKRIGEIERWMEIHDAERPYIISEINLWAGSPEEQRQLMAILRTQIAYRPYMQAAIWFADYYDREYSTWHWAYLLDRRGERTKLGDYYQQIMGMTIEQLINVYCRRLDPETIALLRLPAAGGHRQ